MSRLYFFPNVRQAAPQPAPLTTPEVAALKTLESSIASFVTIGAPAFLDELAAMLSKQAARARELAVERRNPRR